MDEQECFEGAFYKTKFVGSKPVKNQTASLIIFLVWKSKKTCAIINIVFLL